MQPPLAKPDAWYQDKRTGRRYKSEKTSDKQVLTDFWSDLLGKLFIDPSSRSGHVIAQPNGGALVEYFEDMSMTGNRCWIVTEPGYVYVTWEFIARAGWRWFATLPELFEAHGENT